MEFTISCPVDGPIEVGLEDIDTVVLRESERADITFVCPHCGTEITVTAIVPAFLLSAMEAMAQDAGGSSRTSFIITGALGAQQTADPRPTAEDPHADAYCEYFRRQLDRVDSVEDVLDEIDSSRPSR